MRETDTSPQPYFTVLSDFLLNQPEFIVELRSRVNKFASQKEAAKAWGVSESYLSDVLSGWRAPGAKICNAIGYKRVTVYKEITP